MTDREPRTTITAARKGYIEYLRGEGRARKTIVRYQGELSTFEEFAKRKAQLG